MNTFIISSKHFTGSILIAGCMLGLSANAMPVPPDIVRVTDFGARPNSRVNAVPAVQKALEACRSKNNPVLVFPKGRYDFWPQYAATKTYYESNTTDNNPKTLGIFIEKFKNLVVDGQGSSFIYHGTMQPVTLDSAENVTLKNFRVDWDFPLTGQGEVMDTAATYIDVKIDERQYPFEIENGKLMFTGEGWKSGIWIVMEYERYSHIIAPGTGDNPALGKGWQQYRAQRLGNGNIRLTYAFKRKPKPGNVLIFRHSPRDHAAMFILNSKNISLEHVTVNHCAGLGILSQYSENLTFNKVSFIPNAEKGRYFSGHDDGLHFSNCRGNIRVDSCRFAGLMDDPINIHGTYVRIIKKLAPDKLLCRFMEHMSVGMEWARPGESVNFIDNNSLQTVGSGEVSAFKALSPTDFELTLSAPVPDNIQLNYGLENMSWTPSATITHSLFESCRARGLLVSTPKKVIIENNVFTSSGSAILVAGDVNSWYESGAVTDLLIKGNKFLAPVLTSSYQFCEAIISIFPEVPVMDAATPTYHRNIRIIGNEFYPYDYPVLFAQSVNGLLFEDNTLIRSYEYKPFHPHRVTFTFSGCKKVTIANNKIDPRLNGKNISLLFMNKAEVKFQKGLILENSTMNQPDAKK